MHRLYSTARRIVKRLFYEILYSLYQVKVAIDEIVFPRQRTKILVTGFHHSGTSILRKIIGNHTDIKDIIHEVSFREVMYPNTAERVCVMKAPNCDNRVFRACKIAKHIKIVCIVRDPRDVFVSLQKRSGGEYNLEKFKKEWCQCVHNSLAISKWSNGYLVRYEDLFKNDNEEVKKLFLWLGFAYDRSIITKNKDRMVPIVAKRVPSGEPPRIEQELFRSYQINQEFRQMSGQYVRELSHEKRANIENDPLVRALMVSLKYL